MKFFIKGSLAIRRLTKRTIPATAITTKDSIIPVLMNIRPNSKTITASDMGIIILVNPFV